MDLDIEGNGEGIQSMDAGRKNRETFEKWKRNRGFGAGGWRRLILLSERRQHKRVHRIWAGELREGRRMKRRRKVLFLH